MTNNKIVLLTGASRGLGQAAAQIIAARDEPITLLATSRKAEHLNLTGAHKDTVIEYPQLDITDNDSITCLYNDIVDKYGRVDVLINNAGSTFEKIDNSTFGPEIVKKTFDLNYWGVVKMIEKFTPIIPDGGRIVNVSSAASQQDDFPNEELKARLFDEKTNLVNLNALVEEYMSASKTSDESDGWLKHGFYPAYSTSKAFINLLTASSARNYPTILSNALAGDLPKGTKAKTPGTRVILRLAFDDIDNVSGKFWAGKTTADTGPGDVVEDWPGKEIVWDLLPDGASSS
ncbi:uncharacterized protein IL334_006339 [Kwoniella shivajii]|uniref:Short-chain dehydrogenase n=1 Tax=Kwoniella shivajii TaxID=564305 RepID=A0ABZ1D5N3_9TREE|nr:hypothetical protein IL334_006339 [Kwoniella shivajii]